MECFKQKPIPRDSETLFKRFYDLHLINMATGGQEEEMLEILEHC